eukprot:TRINITY_DN12457_c0_g1_i1.p1 TRINITY_DN12457_c0_g1~~TRINITY_DN12457_c0_g1_i1.p1  ORF type:complete len:255 (+),score=53.22 TRINITY_DN12457_c0_g1_i1:54-818(+)
MTYNSMSALIKLQALSGLLFSFFTGLHITDHVVGAIGGTAAHAYLQRIFRIYYQFPAIEIACVVGSALFHASISMFRMFQRVYVKQQPLATDFPQLMFRLAGLALFVLVPGHMFATRYQTMQVSANGVDVTYATVTMQLIPYLFASYLMVLLSTGTYHTLFGVVKALRQLGFRVSAPANNSPFWTKLGVASVAMAVCVVLAFTGVFYRVDIPRYTEYVTMQREYLPQFALWLVEFFREDPTPLRTATHTIIGSI